MKKTEKWLIAAIVALVFLRLSAVPALQGFFVDEQVRKNVVDSVLAGEEIEYNYFSVAEVPVYIEADWDWSPWATFYVPAVLWAKVFGSSELSLRFFAAISTIFAILIFAVGFSLWFAQRKKAFFVFAIIGLTVPWLWLQGMIFWNTTLTPLYFAIAFLAFSVIYNLKSISVRARCLWAAVAVVTLIAVAYNYKPPIAAAAVLCWVMLGYWFIKKIIPRYAVVLLVAMAGILVVPFLMFLFGAEGANDRTVQLSIFTLAPLQMLWAFGKNFVLLCSPIFLFLTGDGNMRHSVGLFGMLGMGLLIPLAYAAVHAVRRRFNKKGTVLFLIMCATIFLNYVATATTNDSMPHSLRAIGVALPWCAIAAMGVMQILGGRDKTLKLVTLGVFAVGAVMYIMYYFIRYAPTSGVYF